MTFANEADVETRFLIPLLTDPALLGIPADAIRSKARLVSAIIDKRSGKQAGYIPDFLIWTQSLPMVVVEAKAPTVDTVVGYREAGLYSHFLNKQYKTGLNPCTILLSTNGVTVQIGQWDAEPQHEFAVTELSPGTSALAILREFMGRDRLESLAASMQIKLRPSIAVQPYTLIGGSNMLNSKKAANSFAAPLSPVLRKYFTSKQQNNDAGIYRDAYVSSDETSSNDRLLDSLMKDRVQDLRGSLSETLLPTKRKEPKVTNRIQLYQDERPNGDLQLITGGVGSGKSLFTRRYKELLQSPILVKTTKWAFIDFNNTPEDALSLEDWICENFIESFRVENGYDAYDSVNWPQVFSLELNRRKTIYEDIAIASVEQATMARANDLSRLIDDPKAVAFGLSRHFIGERRETVVVVVDNVDRLGTEEQLAIFRLSLWFMAQTRALVILGLRDDTYERFKGAPPLDTYRTGIVFHVSPPKFIDVVKRRLELAAEYLANNSAETLQYNTSSSLKIKYSKDLVGEFIVEIYIEVFDRQQNTAKIIQGLAGRDVRKALEIFESILRSGHLSEEAITSKVRGAGAFEVNEDVVLKTLMRTDYRFHSMNSGFITNILYCDTDWDRPSNFIISDVLFWLHERRDRVGEIGLAGFHSLKYIAQDFEIRGYSLSDLSKALDLMLQSGVIESDHYNLRLTGEADCVKITYSGFIHLRLLVSRPEYLYGILPTTTIFNRHTATEIASILEREAAAGDVNLASKTFAISALFRSLKDSFDEQNNSFPGFGQRLSGARYVLEQVEAVTQLLRGVRMPRIRPNILDSL